ncbi:MAG: hypothetical protein R3C56_22475 [Pirellulaceae bacterium]
MLIISIIHKPCGWAAAQQQGDYFPTWNPSEGLGVSIAGQPSAALYYPLRPVWWLPGLDTAQKFSIFIVAHLLIAAVGMRLATRRLGLSDQAAWLAAISYSLSCPVFFQHTNLIYLCSAAWIGFALGAVFTAMQATGRRELLSSCIAFAAAASLMLLGGDPQTAVNAFIMVGVLFVAVHAQCRWSARKLHLSAPQAPKESSRFRRDRYAPGLAGSNCGPIHNPQFCAMAARLALGQPQWPNAEE